MLVRVSGKMLKLGKRWEIQQVVLACPAFRHQEFNGKRALCRPEEATTRSTFFKEIYNAGFMFKVRIYSEI